MAPANKTPWKSGKKALKAKGVGIDFSRVKSKVGRKLPPPSNATRTDFKSKAIVLSSQSLTADKEGAAVNQRKKTLKELLTQSTHYNERKRKEAVLGMKDLFAKFPEVLLMHTLEIVEKLSPRITDTDKAVRQTFLLLLRTSILPSLSQAMMGPLVPRLMAHVCSAMTHLGIDVRATACSFLDCLVQHSPALVVSTYSGQIVQHYLDLLGKGGVSGQALGRLVNVLGSLVKFLTALKSTLAPRRPVAAQTHQQDDAEDLQALQGYKSLWWEGACSSYVQKTGNSEQTIMVAAPLVPVLIDCWADCAPTVCAGPIPDAGNLSSMVSITEALSLLFHCLILGGSTDPSLRTMGINCRFSSFDSEQEHWEMRVWMRREFLPALQKHVLAAFPLVAPVIRLPAKVEKELVALNVGICVVMLHLIVPPNLESNGKEHHATHQTLEYFESALDGMMLPSSEMAAGVIDSRHAEPHVRLLISLLPGLLSTVTQDWLDRLLEAFTRVYELSKAQSSTKLTCLSAMAEMLRPQLTRGRVLVPLQIRKQWLWSLPRVLWELKDTHPSITQDDILAAFENYFHLEYQLRKWREKSVLQMLLDIGRTASNSSPLAIEYASLQPQMIPFFCTFLASSKQGSQWKCLFGPFVKLPRKCQELAVDTLCYSSNFSEAFLKALAHCCLSDDVSLEVATRTVEVLQAVFVRGSSGLAEHLSFLVTMVAGHTSAQAPAATGEDLAESSSAKTRIRNLSGRKDLDSKSSRKRGAVVRVVGCCLCQLGDCNLVLTLLGPLIKQVLLRNPSSETIHSFLCAIAMLSRDKRSDTSILPDTLKVIVPRCIAESLIALGRTERLEDPYAIFCKPCYVLLAMSPMLTRIVLSTFHSFLLGGSGSSGGVLPKEMCGVARASVRMCKEEKLGRVISKAEGSMKAVLHALKASLKFEDESEDNLELQWLCTELEVTCSCFPWSIKNVSGGETAQRPSS